ncbi:MAG: ATP synthase F1 subunit delta [Bacteroidia bacterium]|nr:ATP synthase F1 subunit delta [Bacteroidia bacterium]
MSTATNSVGRIYAESLFELASKQGDAAAQDAGDELVDLVEIVRGDRRFAEFLRSPAIDTAARENALQSLLKGRVSDLVLRFMLVANRKGRLGELEAISDAYAKLLNERFGKVEVDVFTVDGQLDDGARANLATTLKSRLGREPVLHLYKDASMVGGMKLRIGDQLIDGSVAAKLRRMRRALVEDAGAKVRADIGRFLS